MNMRISSLLLFPTDFIDVVLCWVYVGTLNKNEEAHQGCSSVNMQNNEIQASRIYWPK